MSRRVSGSRSWLPTRRLRSRRRSSNCPPRCRAPSSSRRSAAGALALGIGLVSFITGAIIVIALTLYFLASLSDMKNALYALAPARNRPRLADMTERVTASVGSSIIGSVILAGLNAGTVFVLHWVIDLPFAALMAAIAFVITLIPLFGSVIFLVVGSVVALFTSPTQALIFAIAYLIYIQIESYILSPRIMNKAISIPGVLVLIGAMVGGTLLGVLGVLLALPTMAMILLIIREVWVPKQDLEGLTTVRGNEETPSCRSQKRVSVAPTGVDPVTSRFSVLCRGFSGRSWCSFIPGLRGSSAHWCSLIVVVSTEFPALSRHGFRTGSAPLQGCESRLCALAAELTMSLAWLGAAVPPRGAVRGPVRRMRDPARDGIIGAWESDTTHTPSTPTSRSRRSTTRTACSPATHLPMRGAWSRTRA